MILIYIKREKWLYDTPGFILPEQIKINLVLILFFVKMINKCTNREEVSYFDHHSTIIRLVNILLDIGQTILLGEIVKIDVKHVSDR